MQKIRDKRRDKRERGDRRLRMETADGALLDNVTVFLVLWDELFYHFPLVYETLLNIELCNSVISQIQRNQLTLF